MLNQKPKPLVQWFGGKARMAKIIADKMPGHKIYVEPFGGAAGVLMAKNPSFLEIYNDLHSGIVNLFRVVRDKDRCQKLIELLEFTPYSREEWKECNSSWESESDEIEKARKVYVTLAQNFVGATAGGSWGLGSLKEPRNQAQAFCNSLENIKLVANRLRAVQIDNAPAIRVMQQWDSPETLIYADPPYLPETRSIGSLKQYKHEMTIEQHIELLNFLVKSKSMVILSGYPSTLYASTLESVGWIREDYSAIATSALNSANNGLKGQPADHAKRTESLWFSPNATPKTLWNQDREVI